MRTIQVPIQTARIQPQMDLHVRQVGDWVIFAGLVPESEAECRRMAATFWDESQSNGKLARKGAIVNPLAVSMDRYTEWWPDEDALDNIDTTALKNLGVGEIEWHGALFSTKDPLHAGYHRGDGQWRVGDKTWSWRQAIEALMADAGLNEDSENFMSARIRAATEYGQGVIKIHRQILKGDVYGVVAYAARRSDFKRQEDFDHEVWGFVGRQHARASIIDALDEVERSVARPAS